MLHVLAATRQNLSENIRKVDRLSRFDADVLEFAIAPVRKARDALKKFGIEHPNYDVDKDIAHLEHIRENESMRAYYEIMRNHCVVLLVSYFSSAIEDIFRECLVHRIKTGSLGNSRRKKIEVSLERLCDRDFDIVESAAELLVEKNNISFQDMASIARTFSEYFDYDPPKTQDVNNIIAAQAFRHSIVHSGAKLTPKSDRQLAHAEPRSIQTDAKRGGSIQFTEREIKTISESMLKYVDAVIAGVSEQE